MTITAAMFPASPAIARPDRCIGYMTRTPTTETLYARQDGKMFKSNALKRPNDYFNKKGRKWVEVDAIPDHAEFIGHYEKV